MASSLVFYFTFSLLAAALSTTEQKSGLRYSLSLAVVFCLSEVQWLQNATREEAGSTQESSESSSSYILGIFPSRLCLFEKVSMSD